MAVKDEMATGRRQEQSTTKLSASPWSVFGHRSPSFPSRLSITPFSFLPSFFNSSPSIQLVTPLLLFRYVYSRLLLSPFVRSLAAASFPSSGRPFFFCSRRCRTPLSYSASFPSLSFQRLVGMKGKLFSIF